MTGILPASRFANELEPKQMYRPRQTRTLSPTRRALLGAGVTTLALSLALSIAPAWAKSSNSAPSESNGAPGTVKLRDASTSDLVPETSNDPHVCAFSIVFEYNPPTNGTWQILSWPPTGDGSQVSSGSWDTTVGGTDETDVMTEPAGHYRLEYQAVGASNSRNKTFWVAEGCEDSGGSTGGEQGDTGSGEQPGDSGDQGDQTEEGGVQGATGGDQNGTGGSQPGDQSGNAGSDSTNDQPSVQPGNDDGGIQGVSSPTGGEGPTLPNTATIPASALSPLLAALGLLLVIAAHPFIRRSALADRA